MRDFRKDHLLRILATFDEEGGPLDVLMSRHFREHKALGSKDRKEIAECIYFMVRWGALLDALCREEPSWEERLEIAEDLDPYRFRRNPNFEPETRLSFPKGLYDCLLTSLGEEKAENFCWASNFPAPTTVRVNTLKGSRRQFMRKVQERASCEEGELCPTAVKFEKRANFREWAEFREGYFEVQDEGSQALAGLVEAAPGDWVMDYCAGSGGKTLAFAPQMKGKGQIFLHDIRPWALQEGKRRLRRAGVQNGQITLPDDPKLSKLKRKMDWVLVDGPCSGTGTLRRNPEMKWKFSLELLERLQGQQRMIFEKALSYMKPDGKIVYATCSVLKEENDDQVAHFLKTYDLELVGEPLRTLPSSGGPDGFYGAVMKKRRA